MLRAHRDKLRNNRYTVGKDLVVNDELLHKLVENGVLTDSMKEEIDAVPAAKHSRRASLILDFVPKRGPAAFQCFIDALEYTEQGHLASLLDGRNRSSNFGNYIQRRDPLKRQLSQPTDAQEPRDETSTSSNPTESSSSSAERNIAYTGSRHIPVRCETPEQTTSQCNVKYPVVTKPEDEMEKAGEASSVAVNDPVQKNPAKDLTLNTKDTMINISIKKKEKSDSFTTQGLKVYEMKSTRRGLVINMREAASMYEDINMQQLLEALQCTVESKTADSIEKVKDILTEEVENKEACGWDTLFIVIFTNSAKEEFDVRQFYDIFDDNNSPSLAGKPKILIVIDFNTGLANKQENQDVLDACKEDEEETNARTIQTRMQNLTINSKQSTQPPSDVLTAYMYSHRDFGNDTCNIFVLAMAKVFMEFAYCMPLPDMLHEVKALVKRSSIDSKDFDLKMEQNLKKDMFLPPAFPSC